MTTISPPQMTTRYWIERARKELLAGHIGDARGSMRRALEAAK